jgi:hypothetical protein
MAAQSTSGDSNVTDPQPIDFVAEMKWLRLGSKKPPSRKQLAAREARLTHKRLCEVLHYEPGTKEWTWRMSLSPNAPAGSKAAGTLDPRGYRWIEIDGVQFDSMRLAPFYMTGRRRGQLEPCPTWRGAGDAETAALQGTERGLQATQD